MTTRSPRHGLPRWRRPLRVLMTVAAALLLLVGCGLTALAALRANAGGYFATPSQRFNTSTAILKSDEIDVGPSSARAADPDADLGELARVRIVVQPLDPGVRVFIGIGPKDQVEACLRGSAYDEFVSARLDPFWATMRRVGGTGRAVHPAGEPFWVATSTGTGTRTLEWDKSNGTWSVVAMRMDGEPGVDIRASVGLRFGFLPPAGLATILTGVLPLGAIAIIRRKQG
jgi:hypothetical protein